MSSFVADAVCFDGRILFLSADPARVAEQLAGRDLLLAEAGRLRDSVSTDEITPIPVLVHFDDALGRYSYVGFQAGEQRPIGVDAVRQGEFKVTVAGARYGGHARRL